jgi:hypothetical protein
VNAAKADPALHVSVYPMLLLTTGYDVVDGARSRRRIAVR